MTKVLAVKAPPPSFRKRLEEYRDTLLLVLFFAGGLVWIHQIFASKCQLNASLTAQKIQIEQQSRLARQALMRLEVQSLNSLRIQLGGQLNASLEERATKVDTEYRAIAEEDSKAIERIEEAYEACTIF